MSIAGEKGSSLWKLEGKMTLEDTYPLPKTHKRRVSEYLTHARHGKKTKEWDGRGAYSYTDGKDSPTAPKTKRKCVSILCVAEVHEYYIYKTNEHE